MITFGICTGGSQEDRINKLIDSIEKQSIPQYEVLIIGSASIKRANTRIINFDETTVPMWITKKKNIIASEAKYDTLVMMHDYMRLNDDWYGSWQQQGFNFEVACNKLYLKDGGRYLDCSISPWCRQVQFIKEKIGLTFEENLIPYGEELSIKLMYMSGAFFMIKKSILLDVPMNERLKWGDGEDVEWSHRLREKYSFSFNEDASCTADRDGKINPWKQISVEKYRLFKTFIDSDIVDDCTW
jgi:hypothetical protein